MKNKLILKPAFTLAEVLVALMIIGVISAITIPGLKKYSEMQEHVSSLQKAYSSVANATRLAEAQNTEMKRWGTLVPADEEDTATPGGIKTALGYYKKVLNLSKTCENAEAGCWTQTKDLKGEAFGSANSPVSNSVTFQTADGMNWSLSGISDPSSNYGVNKATNSSLLFVVDTNGAKKPNLLGYDVFIFVANQERGVVPAGVDKNSACPSSASDSKTGYTCAVQVLKSGKISY